jgi:hypothetical protein
MSRKQLQDALARLAEAEDRFLQAEFLAPVLAGGGTVQVRIDGVICQLRTRRAGFSGFAVFRPTSHTEAMMVREATMAERRAYLDLFPRVLMVACSSDGRTASAVASNPSGDKLVEIAGRVAIHEAEEVNLFDTIAARFDGTHFWFDALDAATDPAAAPWLRQALADMRDPRQLHRPGLVPGQRTAYLLNYRARLQAILNDQRARAEATLREALEHAGAELRDFADLDNQGIYRVSYDVDGRRHTSIVRKGDLTVQTAGICLSGQDRRFDLQSLVGVLREGATQGR